MRCGERVPVGHRPRAQPVLQRRRQKGLDQAGHRGRGRQRHLWSRLVRRSHLVRHRRVQRGERQVFAGVTGAHDPRRCGGDTSGLRIAARAPSGAGEGVVQDLSMG